MKTESETRLHIARVTRQRRARRVLAAARDRAAGTLSQDEHDGVIALYDAACRHVEKLEEEEAEARMLPRWMSWVRLAAKGRAA